MAKLIPIRQQRIPGKLKRKGDDDIEFIAGTVSMSNALTRAGHGLTLAEKRIMMAAVSLLDSKRTLPKPGEPLVVHIRADEFAVTFDLDPTTAYEQLRDAAKVLYRRSIQFADPAHVRNGKAEVVTNMRWVGEAHYHKGQGWVEIVFWHRIVPHLVNLRGSFTSYKLTQASALRSIYSWRLLELLTRFESTGWAEYDMEDFGRAMEATPKQMADFGQFRRRILDPAVKELREKDNWIIDWVPRKFGRKVTGLRFTFHRDPQARLDV